MRAAAQAVDEPAAMEFVLKKVADLTNSACAYVFAPHRYSHADAASATHVGMQFQYGMPDTFFADYRSSLWKIDPWSEKIEKHLPTVLSQGGFISEDLLGASELRSSSLYANYLKPELGLESMMSTQLSNGYVLSLMRSAAAGAYDRRALALTAEFKFELELVAHASFRASKVSKVGKWRPDFKALGLTAREIQIAKALAYKPPKQVARDMGISVTTVRTHLAAIFAKTGTHRQSELVWLVANL